MHLRSALRSWMAAAGCALFAGAAGMAADPGFEIWHGDRQRVGHLGDAQDDFNVLGHFAAWREIDVLRWTLNGRSWAPVSFRAFRRLAEDGDFNVDVPIARLVPGENVVRLTARLRDGRTVERSVTIVKETGATALPLRIDWATLTDPQDAGQYVDGRWRRSEGRLRTARPGYDRLFLIGERTWRDYEVRTTFIVHALAPETGPHSGGHGLGVILRFAGHVDGGPRHFSSGQPKWGYQPFGAIGWLRWNQRQPDLPPARQFYPGDSDRSQDFGPFAVSPGEPCAVRFLCTTLPDTPAGAGVTRYAFKIWRAAEPEPAGWSWEQVLTSPHALRTGGVALVAHHVDASFGPVTVQPVPAER